MDRYHAPQKPSFRDRLRTVASWIVAMSIVVVLAVVVQTYQIGLWP